MADRDYIRIPETISVEVTLEPAFSAHESLSLLSSTDYLSGINPWIYETADALPDELKTRHHLVYHALSGAVCPPTSFPGFPAYLTHLEAQDAAVIARRAVAWMQDEKLPDGTPLDAEQMLTDLHAFLRAMEAIYAGAKAEKGMRFDPALYRETHRLLSDPPRLKAFLLNHLHTMWTDWLEPEWARKLPMLQESVEAHQRLDYPTDSVQEAVLAITGRDISMIVMDWTGWGAHLVFFPHPHIGPYISRFESQDRQTNWVPFGARMPRGARGYSPTLSRSELNMRLSALADDTRLRILELVVQHGELCSQDVIDLLSITQSAASRNLRQLVATGYLIERKKETAKCYSFNRERFDDTMRALRRFVRTP